MMKVYLFAVAVMIVVSVGCEKSKDQAVHNASGRSSSTKTSEYGGCDFREGGYCLDYTGAGFKQGYIDGATLKADCVSSGGLYISNGCTSEDQLHACTVDKGLNSEAVAHAYKDKNGLTTENWKEICSEMSSAR